MKKQTNISIPLNQLQQVNILKKSIENVIKSSALNRESKDFQTICKYCASDKKYIEISFEYLMNQFETMKTESYFDLIFFLFEKSKRMTELVKPRLYEIFVQALSIVPLQKWTLEKLEELHQKFQKQFPILESLMKSKLVEQVRMDIKIREEKRDEDTIRNYQLIQKEIDELIQRTNAFSKKWYEIVGMIIPYFDPEEKVDTKDEIDFKDSWGMDVKLCQTAYEVWEKYGGSENQQIHIKLKILLEEMRPFRTKLWDKYVVLVKYQQFYESKSIDEQNEYKDLYFKIVSMLDEMDDLIFKTNELKIY